MLNIERPTSNAESVPLNSVFGVGCWALGVCYRHWNVFTTIAGLPATMQFAGTLFVTTEGKLVYSLPGKSTANTVDAAPATRGRFRDQSAVRERTRAVHCG